MMLKKLSLKNYRCFESIEVDFHDRLTVIAGINGSGKTAILEGAAVALGTLFTGGLSGRLSGMSIRKKDARLKTYQMGETEDIQAQYPVEIISEGTVCNKNDSSVREITWTRSLNRESGKTTIKDAKPMTNLAKEYQQRMKAGDQNLILPVIAYYGTGRLWNYRGKKSDKFKENKKTNGYIDSLDGMANLKLMMDWFRKKTVQKAQKSALGLNSCDELDVVYQAICSCFERITSCKDVKILYNLDTNEIDCYYRNGDKSMTKMPLSQMSDGYKSTISLIADIAYRMAVLNPQLRENVLKDTDGVVLIDEVDLHLHPAWQQRILSDLTEIFPKVQFIVTTHSPAVLGSVKSENLIILKDYKALDATSEIYGNDVNSVLKDIMGVSERIPAIAKLFEKFDSLLQAKKYDEAERTLDEIDEQRDFHDKEIVADRVKLKLERIRGGQK